MQTVRQQAANQRRSLRAIRKKVFDLSAAWGEVDEVFRSRLEGLTKQIAEIENEMQEFIKDYQPSSDFEGGNDGNT
jgi:cob(I)alamin adenosyltransferase